MINPFRSKIQVAVSALAPTSPVVMNPYRPPNYIAGHRPVPPTPVEPYGRKLSVQAISDTKVRLRQEANKFYELHLQALNQATAAELQEHKDKLTLAADQFLRVASILDSAIDPIDA